MTLSYPDPPLTDGTVVLRRWAESDLVCVEEAARDPSIPKGTTVPATFTPAEGLAWIERQWGRADNGEGLSNWALTDAGLARVEALVEPDNIASQRVLEKARFRREGLLRSYLVIDRERADAFIYSLLPSDVGGLDAET